MPPVEIDPVKLVGPWTEGWALERRHTLRSDFLGYGPTGNPQFDTERSDLGELVYRLKNRNDKGAAEHIADAAAQFLETLNRAIDLVVPVPPSRPRAFQPAFAIAKAIADRLGKPVNIEIVKKVHRTTELKNVFGYAERKKLLEGAFEVDGSLVKNRRILLVDDLYRSGATAAVVAGQLQAAGAKSILFLAMTKTTKKL